MAAAVLDSTTEFVARLLRPNATPPTDPLRVESEQGQSYTESSGSNTPVLNAVTPSSTDLTPPPNRRNTAVHRNIALRDISTAMYPTLPAGRQVELRTRDTASAHQIDSKYVYLTEGAQRCWKEARRMQHCSHYLKGCCMMGPKCGFIHVAFVVNEVKPTSEDLLGLVPAQFATNRTQQQTAPTVVVGSNVSPVAMPLAPQGYVVPQQMCPSFTFVMPQQQQQQSPIFMQPPGNQMFMTPNMFCLPQQPNASSMPTNGTMSHQGVQYVLVAMPPNMM